jgi:Predicted protease
MRPHNPKIHTNIKFRRFKDNVVGTSYTPKQLASIYGYPTGFNGTGKNVAVIELGGAFSQADLNTYFKSLGLTVKPVVFHSIQGAKNTSDPNADAEVMLDLCVIGAMAPGVQLHCYTAPNTDAGFLAAIEQAITDKVDCISISWGGAEDDWTSASIASFNAAFQQAAAAGITVTAAAGDNGSTDGETGAHVDFPASSPYVCGCGGTSLVSTSPVNEVVWNDGDGATGGGVSSLFTIPTWQVNAGVPGSKKRGVPDIAGNADPETGWAITVDGQAAVVGGTSAVAPMIAALAAVLGQALGKNVGFLPSVLYTLPSGAMRDITSGNNGTYIAKAGFDCCTGQGVPVGTKLLAALTPAPAPVPTPVPTPVPPTPVPTPTSTTRTITVTGTSLAVTVDGKTV